MNRIIKTVIPALVLPLLLSAGLSSAQQAEAPRFVPVEIYICEYNKGKSGKDLQRVIDKWNKWADEKDKIPYSAWLLTPFFFDSANNFDVGWMGAWPDGNAMGASLHNWMTDSGNLSDDFDKVIDCGGHSNFASTNIRPPGGDWPGERGLAVFSDCNVAEGKTIPDALAVHRAWAKHLDSIGSKAGMWVFFPGFGTNERNDDDDSAAPGYDYKIVASHPDMKSVGAYWENYTNGGGYMKGMELGAGVLTCDSPRIYDSRTIRNGNFDPS